MKKITFLTFLGLILVLASPTQAQSPIAVQNDSGTSFYSTLDLAITNATSGDYIYLPGGNFTISVPINKTLQIVGVGHNPDSCKVTGITQITGSFTINSGSSHGTITGLKISGGITFTVSATDPVVDYYSIERCNIGGNIYLSSRLSNILINECIIRGQSLVGYKPQGFQMSKCIMEHTSIENFDSNASFINNIFIYAQFWNGNAIIQNSIFKNNIFLTLVVEYNPNWGDFMKYCLLQNNLFNADLLVNSYNTNTHQNNLTGPVTTLFVNQSGTIFDYKQDYHILTSSPAHNAGTDGTDLGIYGTGTPWKEGSLPSNPHIQSKSISTVNGNLNVKIKVAAQDN